MIRPGPTPHASISDWIKVFQTTVQQTQSSPSTFFTQSPLRKGDCSSVTGRFWHGPRNQASDRALRRMGGQLGVVERVPSRSSLSLPSDPQIGPGNRATVSNYYVIDNTFHVRCLVRGGLWHFATHDDEAAASVRLRPHLHGVFPQRRVEREPGIWQGRELSDDARLVQAVRAAVARAGISGRCLPAAEVRAAGMDARPLGPGSGGAGRPSAGGDLRRDRLPFRRRAAAVLRPGRGPREALQQGGRRLRPCGVRW